MSARRRSRALSGDVKLRACIRMLTTPFGKKREAVRLLTAELGRAPSSLYNWRRRYREAGPSGFSHDRADKGIPRVYSEAEFESRSEEHTSELQSRQYL